MWTREGEEERDGRGEEADEELVGSEGEVEADTGASEAVKVEKSEAEGVGEGGVKKAWSREEEGE